MWSLKTEIRNIFSEYNKKPERHRFWIRSWILRRNEIGVSGTNFEAGDKDIGYNLTFAQSL